MKEWIVYVESDLRAFSTPTDWKDMVLEAGVWNETVMRSGKVCGR